MGLIKCQYHCFLPYCLTSRYALYSHLNTRELLLVDKLARFELDTKNTLT